MKILIAEDDRITRRVLEMFLRKWGYDVVQASDGNEAWELLRADDAPRLALLDWVMPGRDGLELCREIRKRKDPHYVYILLVTMKGRKQDILEGLEAGADDYIVKPFDPHELQARLRVGQRIVELHEQLLAAGEALRFQATHDPLTSLWNRGANLDLLRRELARSKREGYPVAVALADLDHFKRVNDVYGHQAGDMALKEAASRILAQVRSYDAVGRYGGEEFLIVSPGSDIRGATRQAERIRKGVAALPVATQAGEISLTISLGVADNHLPGVSSLESLLCAADLALYRAKENGRNRVELADGAEAAESLSLADAKPGPSSTSKT
jgi:diguanylate cyclase (GGDEF)-like protein